MNNLGEEGEEEEVQMAPPPVVPDPDTGAHLHRRASDHEDAPVKHKRWYDNFAAKWAAVVLILGALGTAVGIGYAGAQFIWKVDATPADVARNRQNLQEMEDSLNQIHLRMWASINAAHTGIADLNQKFDDIIQVQLETLCYLQTTNPSEQQRCVQEQTQRRIQGLLHRITPPTSGGTR